MECDIETGDIIAPWDLRTNMNRILLAAVIAASFSGYALAGPCQDDLAKIDEALSSTKLPPKKRAAVEDMRSQAVQLCAAGNEQEGLDVTTEAKATLGIE